MTRLLIRHPPTQSCIFLTTHTHGHTYSGVQKSESGPRPLDPIVFKKELCMCVWWDVEPYKYWKHMLQTDHIYHSLVWIFALMLSPYLRVCVCRAFLYMCMPFPLTTRATNHVPAHTVLGLQTSPLPQCELTSRRGESLVVLSWPLLTISPSHSRVTKDPMGVSFLAQPIPGYELQLRC